MFKVKFTATVVNPDTEETFNGWVDMVYSRRTLFTHEDSVTRTHDFDTLPEAVEFIESEIGATEHDPGSDTWYAADGDMEPVSGETWLYAAHVTED